MKYISIKGDTRGKGVAFWFAVEEYAARMMPKDEEYFFIWQVDPCIMVGRNQLIENEIDIEYCKSNNVAITRRKSGGGCIYSDEGCLLFSYIDSDHDAARVFARRMQDTARVIEGVGIPVSLSGRNDILVYEKKVAGAAIYRCGDRTIMHNSLLFNTDFAQMQKALRPPKAKLESKGVQSVSQRVGNVGDYTSMSSVEFIAMARKILCNDECIVLDAHNIPIISELEAQISSDEFVYGSNPSYSIIKRQRIEGVGTIEARMELKNNTIKSINFNGDFFLLGDIDHEIFARLKGKELNEKSLLSSLDNVAVDTIIRGLSLEALVGLLLSPTVKAPTPERIRKPAWLKTQSKSGEEYFATQKIIQQHNLHTICESGRCPNRAECWKNSTATFMIGGDICTRNCHFCNTRTGKPAALDNGEPDRVAESVRLMGIRYAVITSVDRDDLPDFGAAHWAKTLLRIKEVNPHTRIEALIPDFQGRKELLDIILHTSPDIIGHNMETVERLTPSVRSVARYAQSLDVLRYVELQGGRSKTGFMLGLGESDAEIEQLLLDIRATGCRRLTVGQYLQPTFKHLPVVKYYTPDEFETIRQKALSVGFIHVVSGPLVRSSYHASEDNKL